LYYQLKTYVKFLFKATNQHGVHSPFVFNLVTKCFYNKANFSEYSILEKYRDHLLQSKKTIEITEFGAGSRVFKSNTRPISAIAKNAGISRKRQQLLFRLANYLQVRSILELGTSLGLGTSALTLGNPLGKTITVEGCPATSEEAKKCFKLFGLNNIELYHNTFEDFFRKNTKTYDLVYIDGSHNKEKTLRYFEILQNRIHNNSVVLFDDIYWSREMTEAWQEIIKHPNVRVSIDTYQWGILFFRKEQKKQHFSIRL